jgi:hypothetical protein
MEESGLERRGRIGSTTRRALAAGAAGVATVTALNEGVRRVWDRAPRVDLLGRRAVGRIARAAGLRPGRKARFRAALAGELLVDGAYFALAGLARRNLAVGTALGLAAGAGALALPGPLGLGTRPTRRARETAWATVAWYVAAGIAAGAAGRALRRRNGSVRWSGV